MCLDPNCAAISNIKTMDLYHEAYGIDALKGPSPPGQDKYVAMVSFFGWINDEQDTKGKTHLSKMQAFHYFQKIMTSPMALNKLSKQNSTTLTLEDAEGEPLKKVLTEEDIKMLKKANEIFISADSHSHSWCPTFDLKKACALMNLAIELKTRVLTKHFGHANFPDLEHLYSARGFLYNKAGQIGEAQQDFVKSLEILIECSNNDSIIISQIFFGIDAAFSIPCLTKEVIDPIIPLCMNIINNIHPCTPTEHLKKCQLYTYTAQLLRLKNDFDASFKLLDEGEKYMNKCRKIVRKDMFQESQQHFQAMLINCFIQAKQFSKILKHIKKLEDMKIKGISGLETLQIKGKCYFHLEKFKESMDYFKSSLTMKCSHSVPQCNCYGQSWFGLLMCSYKLYGTKKIHKYLKHLVDAKMGYKKLNLILRQQCLMPKCSLFFHVVKTKSTILLPCDKCGKCRDCTISQATRTSKNTIKENKEWRLFKNSNMFGYFMRRTFVGDVDEAHDESFVLLR